MRKTIGILGLLSFSANALFLIDYQGVEIKEKSK